MILPMSIMRSTVLLTVCLLIEFSCSKDSDHIACDSGIQFDHNICLAIEHHGLSSDQESAITLQTESALAAIQAIMPIKDLLIRIVDNPSYVIPEIGLGGYNPNDKEVIISIDAHYTQLDQSIDVEYIPQLAHEIHHAKRRRAVGYGNTLLQAVVSEGLADHFSIEVTGINPPIWSLALDSAELQGWILEASKVWHNTGYDHNQWFYGSGMIPRWTGYAIGYELVRGYLEGHPEAMASTLFAEPASSFEP